MFKDIRGRELHLGDLIIYDFNVILTEYVYGVLIAENKVAYYSGEVQSVKKNTHCFLIESPTSEELAIRDKIIEKYSLSSAKEMKLKAERVKLGTSYNVGDVLSCPYGDFIYLGNINLVDITENKFNFSGNMYLSVPSFSDKKVFEFNIYNYLQNVFKLKCDDYSLMIENGKEVYGSSSTNQYLFITKGKSSRFSEVLCNIDISEFNNCCLNYYKVLPLGSVKHILLQLKM